ncbi:hypothetical protein [Leucothrix mucor]|uniref:hypothetical protein n=1 Tax=Leucothrix mucor TaxID=45248 RepID=UPI0003B5707E|nr:hypothetical protein [Leucothrix mucor]
MKNATLPTLIIIQIGMSWLESGVRNNPQAELRIAELLSVWRNAQARVVHV